MRSHYHRTSAQLDHIEQHPYPSPVRSDAEYISTCPFQPEDDVCLTVPTPVTPSASNSTNAPTTPVTPALSTSGFPTPAFCSPSPFRSVGDVSSFSSTPAHHWSTQALPSPCGTTGFPFILHQDGADHHVPCHFDSVNDMNHHYPNHSSLEDWNSIYSPQYIYGAETLYLEPQYMSGFGSFSDRTGTVEQRRIIHNENSRLHFVKEEDSTPGPTFTEGIDFLQNGEDDKYKNSILAETGANGKEKDFVCDHVGCGRKFARSNNLKSHKSTHDPNRSKQHKCDVPGCRYSIEGFGRQTDLDRHKKSVHFGMRPFACPNCSQTFGRRDGLIRHGVKGCKFVPRPNRETKSETNSPARACRRSPSNAGISRIRTRRSKNESYVSKELALRLARAQDTSNADLELDQQSYFSEDDELDWESSPSSPFMKQEEI